MSTRDHPDWWKPVGGANAQDSTLERRSLLWNDNNIVAPTVPANFITGERHYGKFFPRGARGLIDTLTAYCRAAAGGLFVIAIAPTPCTAPLYAWGFNPGVPWGWYGVTPRIFWNYDSLFIFIDDIAADVSWAYEPMTPYDMHHSNDLEYTWIPDPDRIFMRASYAGETPGDVPISGTINAIVIPNMAPAVTPIVTLNVGAGADVYANAGIFGYGNLFMWHVKDDNALADLCPILRVDGNRVDLGNVPMDDFHDLYTELSDEGFQWGQYDAAGHLYTLWLKQRVPVRHQISIGFHNSGAVLRTGYVWQTIEQLR